MTLKSDSDLQFRIKSCSSLWSISTTLLLIVLTLSLLFSSVSAGGNADWEVRYSLQAQISGSTLVSTGDLELWLTNNSHTAIESILISNGSGRILIDSILWHGSPMDSSRFVQTERSISISLSVPIAPGQTENFLLRFSSDNSTNESAKAGQIERLTDWFPALVSLTESCVDGERDFHLEKIPAKVSAMIEIGANFDLLTPGELLNEKTHYGLLDKKQGTIIRNITGLTGGVDKAVAGASSDSGETKRYYVRGEKSPGFDLLIGQQITIDMLFHAGGRTIIGYDPSNQPEWIEDQITEILEIQTLMNQFLPGDSTDRFVVGDQDGELPAISLALARSRVSLAAPWLRVTSFPDFDGFSIYLALAMLQNRPGVKSENMAVQLESAFEEFMAAANSCQRFNRFKLIPARLELIRQELGDSLFRVSFLTKLRQCESGTVGTDESLQWIDNLDSASLVQADLSIESASVEAKAAGSNVEVVINSSRLWQPSIDIGFYGSSNSQEIVRFTHDQLWATGRSTKVSQQLAFMPHSVMIDPGGQLPDRKRDDNYYRLSDDAPPSGPTSEILFPPFRQNK